MAMQDTPPLVGHVQNGVVVIDASVHLPEGQTVRIEPIDPDVSAQSTKDREELLQRMRIAFAKWDEEDSKLTDEEGDRLRVALEQHRGLSFRNPKLD